MSTFSNLLSNAFRWRSGRQGSGYDKMLLATARWPLPFDSYLIRYPEGAEIPPHTDPVTSGRHYRLNIVLKSPRSGGGSSFARHPSSRRAASSSSGQTLANTA